MDSIEGAPQKAPDKAKSNDNRDKNAAPLDGAEKNAYDKTQREQPGEKHREVPEREKRDDGPGRAGYTSGAKDLPKDSWDKAWNSLAPDARHILQTDPTSTLYVGISASRLGSKESNQQLTEVRAQHAEKVLRERFGVKGNIVTDAMGEAANPDHSEDDPRDRFMQMNIQQADKPFVPEKADHSLIPPEKIAESLANSVGLSDLSNQNNIPEFIHDGLDTFKAAGGLLKDILKDDFAGGLKDTMGVVKDALGKLKGSLDDKTFQGNVGDNMIPAIQGRLDKLVGYEGVGTHNAPLVDSPAVSKYNDRQTATAQQFVKLGGMLADNWAQNLSPAQKRSVQEAAKDYGTWIQLQRQFDRALHNGLSQRRGHLN